MSNNIAIKINELCKNFATRQAVKSLNLEIYEGQIFSLLGTNGAGKTTTIKMLSCLLKPTSGSATVLGFDLIENSQKIKSLIGVSPQETAIAERLTSWENLILIGGVYGLSKSEAKKRAKELMEIMELEDRKDLSKRLSGGLQRRLSIAMALMSDPKILFLDEPTLGLDPQSRKSVWNYIERLKTKKTIFLTTHYLEEADSLADCIAIMNNGEIIEIGSSDELKKKHNKKQTLVIKADNIDNELIEILNKNHYETNFLKNCLEISNLDLDFYNIVDILKKKGIKIRSIEKKEPTLDEIFLNLTKKEEII